MAARDGLTIDQDVARALAEGSHGDPFSVFGLHERDGRFVLTAFVPERPRADLEPA